MAPDPSSPWQSAQLYETKSCFPSSSALGSFSRGFLSVSWLTATGRPSWMFSGCAISLAGPPSDWDADCRATAFDGAAAGTNPVSRDTTGEADADGPSPEHAATNTTMYSAAPTNAGRSMPLPRRL